MVQVVTPLLKRSIQILISRDEADASADAAEVADECSASFDDSKWGLRIGAIFIIMATSIFGTVLPIVLRSNKFIPRPFFDFAKYFGSGVIIATAFIHLLAPAFDELGSDCLSGTWKDYDWAPAFALIAVFLMFFAETAAYRAGTKRLEKLGVDYTSHAHEDGDAHSHPHQHNPELVIQGEAHPGHVHESRVAHATKNDPESALELAEKGHGPTAPKKRAVFDDYSSDTDSIDTLTSKREAAAQLIGVAVLEFGIVLHSIVIGLTLAVSDEFTVLFIVIIFHQMFEGLGLGSRLAGLHLPSSLGYVRYLAAILYAICTPIGMAAGLGVRKTYNGNGVAANITTGILDAISAGILLYTGLVELLAHEILLNPRMMKSSNGKLAYVFICMSLGAGLMALLGRWA